MERATIKETNLDFMNLAKRSTTDMIVIHHTGSVHDMDASAEQIHGWHLKQGWAGIGYHFVIRKNGIIERGRPEWAVGSHAYSYNSNTLGIHISGDFNAVKPTNDQIEKCAMLVANLCADYDIPIDRKHIVGHGELDPSVTIKGCPGLNLAAKLDTISNKAKGYATKTYINEENIWHFLKGKGLNDYAIAGIMGNLYAESGLDPTNLENYYESKLGMTDEEYTKAVDYGTYTNFVNDNAGYGLAQWTYHTRKAALLTFAKAQGRSIGDIHMQLEYLWQEMQGYRGMMEKLRNAKTVKEASNAVLLDFERPADQSDAVKSTRARFAQDFYDEYAIANQLSNEEKKATDVSRYNTVEEIPTWGKPTIQKMIDKGLLGGTSGKNNLDLSLDMIRCFVVNDRAGLYR